MSASTTTKDGTTTIEAAKETPSIRMSRDFAATPAQLVRAHTDTVREDRLVQTVAFEGFPDSVALETMWFEDLGEGRTRLHTHPPYDSYEARDRMLSSGMDVSVNDGYAKLDGLLADGRL